MCGIAGFFNSPRSTESFPSILTGMLSLIRHRGPDEAGWFVDDHVAMGTVRLRIIDLDSGAQPLSDPGGRYWICYNGELYNYRELRLELEALGQTFRTKSDTEVVLQAWMRWGEAALPRFNGAFSFAIYDTRERSLFLARDRFGKRPLFYAEREGEFVFASEMKAFLALDDFHFEPDPAQTASILAVWTPLPDQTGFKHIHQLPMGEYLDVRGGRVSRRQYASLALDGPPFEGTEPDALEEIRRALRESVALRLRSDVEVGVYLSGGLDSAIVTHLVTDAASAPVSTFSVEFEDAAYDESVEQRIVADHFGTTHSSIMIGPSEIAGNFPLGVFHAEVPAFRTAFVPMLLLSRHVHDAGIKVILSGEGADEAFLGYDIFKETLLRKAWASLGNEERKAKLATMYPWLGHFGSAEHVHLLGLFQEFSEETRPGLFSHEMRFQNGRFAARLLKTRQDPFSGISDLVAAERAYADFSPVEKAQWLEFKTLLPGYLLSTQGERMSLANGVENRCPFLDPDVVALASSVNLRFDDGFREKYLLRQAFEPHLPKPIVDRRKHPYRAPDSAAFVARRPDYLDLLLSESELEKIDYLNPAFCRALANKILSSPPEEISTKENQAFIFLLSLAILHRIFVRREEVPRSDGGSFENLFVKRVDRRSVRACEGTPR